MKIAADGISALTRKKRKNSRDEAGVYIRAKGKRFWKKIGFWDDPDIQTKHRKFLAQYYADAVSLDEAGDEDTHVLAMLFNKWLDAHKNKKGKDYDHVLTMMRAALSVLPEDLPMKKFNATAFRAVRRAVIAEGETMREMELTSPSGATFKRQKKVWCRAYANKILNKLRQVLKWGVSYDLVPVEVLAKVQTVEGIRAGESELIEKEKVREVSDDVLRATLPWLNPVAADMVRIQRACCMRPSEVCRLLVMDIDRTGEVWTAVIHNKIERVGVKRIVAFGPEEIRILKKRIAGKGMEEAVFSPRDAMEELYEEKRAKRKTPLTPSQRKRDEKRRATRLNGLKMAYDANSYRHAVKAAVEKANRNGVRIPHWFPYQIRHQAYTANSLQFGQEAAAYIAGHTSIEMARVYDHKERALAVMAAKGRTSAWWEET